MRSIMRVGNAVPGNWKRKPFRGKLEWITWKNKTPRSSGSDWSTISRKCRPLNSIHEPPSCRVSSYEEYMISLVL
ncbi:hypothetical protein CDAR_448301 [Caerostris darwini]|uniref:Ycf15 n=1 Tax=Caerostris darwini TaxID=1538125 RepID=A0AAV4SFX9_9ARAC|nr:hypothetical protein CDAR_448301 [Caerostris darwini]